MAQAVATIGMSEVKANFSKVANRCHETRVPITVFKHNKPWVNITPVEDVSGEFVSFDSLPQETKDAVASVESAIQSGEIDTWKTYSSADELFSDLGIHA